jgi:hypothetical protein
MKLATGKVVTGVLGLLVGLLLSFVYADSSPQDTATVQNVATTTATVLQTNADTGATIDAVYPLFNERISWSPKVAVSLPPRSNYNPLERTIVGYQVTSLPTASTENIGDTIEPLRNYYNEKLLPLGWRIQANFQADGPGGSVWGFRRGEEVLILSYTSTFFNNQPDTPSQCPCTVVFTIIGGTLQ